MDGSPRNRTAPDWIWPPIASSSRPKPAIQGTREPAPFNEHNDSRTNDQRDTRAAHPESLVRVQLGCVLRRQAGAAASGPLAGVGAVRMPRQFACVELGPGLGQ